MLAFPAVIRIYVALGPVDLHESFNGLWATVAEQLREERTIELDLVPGRLVKSEIVRPKYRHRLDRGRSPLLAPAPARMIPGGHASAGLIASIVIGKYVDHLPFFRQERMSVRWGAAISRRTMLDWVEGAAKWLKLVMTGLKRQTPPQSQSGKACAYLLNHGTSWWRSSSTPSPVSTIISSRTRSGRPSSSGKTGSSSAIPTRGSAPRSSPPIADCFSRTGGYPETSRLVP